VIIILKDEPMNKILSMRYFGNHNHSEMSNLRFLDCNIKVEKLIDVAVELGLTGISLTDHESISGHIKAINKVKELREKGIDFTVGLGDEIYIVDDMITAETYVSGESKFPHLVIVAKDMIGNDLLRKISSEAWGNSFKTGRMYRVPISRKQLSDIVKYNKGHLIASSACLGSTLGELYKQYINTDQNDSIKIQSIINKVYDFINYLKDLFGEDLYLELQPSYNPEQIGYNKFLINLSKLCSIKTIFTTDTHYTRPEERGLHRDFLQSQQADREIDEFYETTYLMSTEEVWSYFKDYIDIEFFKEMIDNSNELRSKIQFYDLKRDTVVPQIQIPPFSIDNCNLINVDEKYEYIHNYSNSQYLIDKYLIFKIEEGMNKKGLALTDEYLSRINIELEQLWKISERLNSRLSSYYLLVQEVVALMWTISLVGTARGSGTGFLLNYLLEITQVNPFEFDLPWWRHINSYLY